MDSRTAKEGLESLAMVAVHLLERGLDHAVQDPGPASAYVPAVMRLEALASDLGAIAAAMAVITRRAASS